MDRNTIPIGKAEELPLISNGFLTRMTLAIALLAALSAAINLGGRELGTRFARAGHSDSNAVFTVTVGQDALRLSANTIRFEEQRKDGPTDSVDLYFLWPEMSGYHPQYRNRFDDAGQSSTLIFAQLSQSTMSRDMSGRIAPIYEHLYDGPPEPAAAGLSLHRLKPESGFAGEVMLTAPRLGMRDYAVRCILPAPGTPATSGDCQRDIHLGRDLTLLYRFSSELLPDWDRIDMALRNYFEQRLAPPAANSAHLNEIRAGGETIRSP